LILLDAANNLANLLYGWNVVDLPELVIEDRETGTPYHHVTTALEKVLVQAGLTADEKMDFYEMVTTGMVPIQAKWRILDNRPQGDDESEF
jgi:hypothetical protein